MLTRCGGALDAAGASAAGGASCACAVVPTISTHTIRASADAALDPSIDLFTRSEMALVDATTRIPLVSVF
jgi:hypothetical protein